MVKLIVSVIFLQIWFTSGSAQCGLAPTVTLNCADGFAHADYAPSQRDCDFDCRAYWTCVNAANTDNAHREESSTDVCNPNDWTFSIPWDYYYCNVTVFYWYFDWRTFLNARSPGTIKSCIGNSIELPSDKYFEVDIPNEVNCTIYTGKETSLDNVSISWIGPDGVITNDSSGIIVVPTTSDGHIHTSTLQFSNISEEDDNTSYNCTASLLGGQEPESLSKSFTMNTLTFTLSNVDDYYFEVGQSHEVNCTVYSSNGTNPDDMSISWIGPNGTVTNDSSRITTFDGHIHTSTLQFSYISEEDDNTSYTCTASLTGGQELLSKSLTLTNLTIDPSVSANALDDQHPTINEPFLMECNVTVSKGVIGSVDFTWRVNDTVIGAGDTTRSNDLEHVLYRNVHTIPQLQMSHNNSVYYCIPKINTSVQVMENNDSITINIDVEPTSTSTSLSSSTYLPIPSSTVMSSSIPTDTTTSNTNTGSSPGDVNVPIIISSIAAVITVGVVIFFTVYCLCKEKRNLKFIRTDIQVDTKLYMIPDDNYTVQPDNETSTIDYEYLRGYYKAKKWTENCLEMSTPLDEEQSSLYSPSVTNEKMLDSVTNGNSTKEHDTNSTYNSDAGTPYCGSYNASGETKNDTGYYSGSNESAAHSYPYVTLNEDGTGRTPLHTEGTNTDINGHDTSCTIDIIDVHKESGSDVFPYVTIKVQEDTYVDSSTNADLNALQNKMTEI